MAHPLLTRALMSLSPQPSFRSLAAASQGDIAAMRLAVDIASGIDAAAFAALHARFRGRHFSKYLDYPSHIARACRNALSLGLVGGPKRRILDLGSGAGYFAYVCGQLGHEVVALDLGDIEMYNALVKMLGVNRVIHRIEVGDLLPALPGRFDFCTAFQVCFDRAETGHWDSPEWIEFLEALSDRHMVSSGQIYIGLNNFSAASSERAGLREWFEAHGATRRLEGFYWRDLAMLMQP